MNFLITVRARALEIEDCSSRLSDFMYCAGYDARSLLSVCTYFDRESLMLKCR